MEAGRAIPHAAIACGGTGGHLFPGLAVADALLERGCEVLLLVSPKEVDQNAVRHRSDLEVVTLRATGLEPRHPWAFARGFAAGWRAARAAFRARPPRLVLSMGGFVGGPALVAGKAAGASTCLHEANSIPGRANRWLVHWADTALVYFPEAARRLLHRDVRVAGMPVRSQFQPQEPGACRRALGLDPERPVLLVTGGSQGAKPLNDLLTRALPLLSRRSPQLQYLHLTGPTGAAEVREAYAALRLRACTMPFLTEMELALGAATVALARAGASFLAEMAAVGLPAILVPFPFAADDHQYHNARAFAHTGAARLLEQPQATPERLTGEVLALTRDEPLRQRLVAAQRHWHLPGAAEGIAELLLRNAGLEPSGAGPAGGGTLRAEPGQPRLPARRVP